MVVIVDFKEGRAGGLSGDLNKSGEVYKSIGFEVIPGFMFLC